MRQTTNQIIRTRGRERVFPKFLSKIMLFGEYGIIRDSMGLSVPFDHYSGTFRFMDAEGPSERELASGRSLRSYLLYLWELKRSGSMLFEFDFSRFENDLYNGLYFDSSIPQGFGVGSSGALCAAIYEQYGLERISREGAGEPELAKLKQVFGQMESHFHGKSSGLDPLICYLGLPVLLRSSSDMESIALPEQGKGKGAVFLLNSGMASQTQPLVELFAEKCSNPEFSTAFNTQFVTATDNCIRHFLHGEQEELFRNLRQLSAFVLEHLSPMIPPVFRDLWTAGLESGKFQLKLCGSGGGGYLLGFAEDMEAAREFLSGYDIREFFRI